MDTRTEDRATTPPPTIGFTGALAFALAVAVARLVSHAWNIPPVEGLALCLGARYRSWLAFALPLALRLVTDVILMIWLAPIGYTMSMADAASLFGFIYLSLAISVVIGRLVQGTRSPVLLTLAGCCGVLQFFVVTNFGSWLTGGYPRTVVGLLASYEAGLPFLRNSIIAGLIGFWMFLLLHELYLILARHVAVRENASEAV